MPTLRDRAGDGHSDGLRAHVHAGVVPISVYPLKILPLPFSTSPGTYEADPSCGHLMGPVISQLVVLFSQWGALEDQRVRREAEALLPCSGT